MAKAWQKITAQAAVESFFASPSVDLATGRLYDNPFRVPETMKARLALLDVANFVSAIASGTDRPALWTMEEATAKHGLLLSNLVANPFVQDQMLCDPTRWGKVVNFARQAVKVGPWLPWLDGKPGSVHEEAVKFLQKYDTKVKKCKARMTKAAPYSGVQFGTLICVRAHEFPYAEPRALK
jgi:hypothetical protein